MRLTFGEILTQLFNEHALSYSPLTAETKSVKNLINFIQSDICRRVRYWWRKELKEFETVAEYATGTVTIATSSGVSTVTGLLTVWTSAMEGRRFIINGEKIAYRVNTVSSVTSLILDRVYINPANQTNTLSTASSYHIAEDRFLLPRDFAGFVYQNLRDIDEETNLTIKSDTIFDQEYPSPYDVDKPTMAIMRSLRQESFYNTGTITITTTSGISTVTGSSTVFTSAMVGKTFRVRGESREYSIASYTSATSITINPKYVNPNTLQNTLSTATDYDIDPAGSVELYLYPFPKYQTHIKYWAYCELPRLVEDYEVSLIPDHKTLMSGCRWQMAIYKRLAGDKRNELLAEYERDIEVLKSDLPAVPKTPGGRVRLSEYGTL